MMCNLPIINPMSQLLLILQCDGITERSRIVEMWSGAAQYCLLVGNYNSATAILESLDATPVARLTGTVNNKLSNKSPQRDFSSANCFPPWHCKDQRAEILPGCTHFFFFFGYIHLLKHPQVDEIFSEHPWLNVQDNFRQTLMVFCRSI